MDGGRGRGTGGDRSDLARRGSPTRRSGAGATARGGDRGRHAAAGSRATEGGEAWKVEFDAGGALEPSLVPAHRYLVGIDLGTTHTVVAYADLKAAGAADIHPILHRTTDQVPSAVAVRPLLPSVRYHPAEGELAAADSQLPLDLRTTPGGVDNVVLGLNWRVERGHGCRGGWWPAPKLAVACRGGSYRARCCPGAAEEIAKVSPVVASASYLAMSAPPGTSAFLVSRWSGREWC